MGGVRGEIRLKHPHLINIRRAVPLRIICACFEPFRFQDDIQHFRLIEPTRV
jgi:hypothetical protein